MNRIKKISIWTSIGIGVLFLFPFIHTCERFTPADDVYIYTDTIILQSGSTYVFSGGLLNIGRNEITQHGFCWSEDNEPAIEQDSSNMLGEKSEVGEFSSIVTGLNSTTTYYVRAYATTDAGTEYSKVKWFATPAPSLPVVSTAAVSSITQDSAWSGGTITDDGGSPVTARGVCWDTIANPMLEKSHTTDGSGTGSFTSVLTGLSCNTTYYIRAYATNAAGTAYGNQVNFTSGSCPSVPDIQTSEITNLTHNSAQCGGNVTDEGTSAVEARGVCWDTTETPTISKDHTTDGSGPGIFTSEITDLTRGTTYYVRAYATNPVGTAYGNEVSFTTLDIPKVTTGSITDITVSSAEGGGEVVSDGGDPVTSKGLCWSTNPNPTTADFTTNDGIGTGSFSSSMTDLTLFTKYYVRAYATNSVGTGYGDEISFTTWQGSVTDYNGNMYPTIVIGDQTWMQKNLNVTHYADGTPISLEEDSAAWAGMTETDTAYCWYDNNSSSGYTYGALYTWAAAMKGANSSDINPSGVQGVCPDGWHLPSDEEWKQLEMHLGMSQAEADDTGYRGTDEGGKLKETGITHWADPNAGATNESGFTALPGGYRKFWGPFTYIGISGYWWSSSEGDAVNAYSRFLTNADANVYRGYLGKGSGFSVRCVKDQP